MENNNRVKKLRQNCAKSNLITFKIGKLHRKEQS